jgi:hypothetical protein
MIHGVIQRWTLPLIGNVCVNWYCGRVDARISLDEGRTWSVPVRFDDQVGALPRAKPLHHPTLGDLVPLYREGPRTAHVRALNLAAVSPGEVPSSRLLPIPGYDIIQPSLVLLPGGQVRAYLRDSRRTAIRTSLLDPATMSWTPPVATDLANPDSGIDAFTDDAGDIVIIYNPSTSDRRTLAVAASRDGIHFPERCVLVSTDTEGDVAYPVVIRARDRTWHVIYSAWAKTTIRHFRFDSEWLRLSARRQACFTTSRSGPGTRRSRSSLGTPAPLDISAKMGARLSWGRKSCLERLGGRRHHCLGSQLPKLDNACLRTVSAMPIRYPLGVRTHLGRVGQRVKPSGLRSSACAAQYWQG